MARIKLNPKTTFQALEQLKHVVGLNPKTTIGELKRRAEREVRLVESKRKPSMANVVALLRDKNKTAQEVGNARNVISSIAEELHGKKFRRQGMQDAQRSLQTGKVQSKLLNTILENKNERYTPIDKKTVEDAIDIAVKRKLIPKELKPVLDIPERIPFETKNKDYGKKRRVDEVDAFELRQTTPVKKPEITSKNKIEQLEYDAKKDAKRVGGKLGDELLSRGLIIARKKEPRPKLPVMKLPRVLEGKDKTNAMMYDAEDKIMRQNLRRKLNSELSRHLSFRTSTYDEPLKSLSDDEIKNKINTYLDYFKYHAKQDKPSLYGVSIPDKTTAREKYPNPKPNLKDKIENLDIDNNLRAKSQRKYLDAFTDTVGRLQDRGKTKPTPRTRKPQDDEKLFNRKYLLELEDMGDKVYPDYPWYEPRVRSRKTGKRLWVDWNNYKD